jgi:hypothetical protein
MLRHDSTAAPSSHTAKRATSTISGHMNSRGMRGGDHSAASIRASTDRSATTMLLRQGVTGVDVHIRNSRGTALFLGNVESVIGAENLCPRWPRVRPEHCLRASPESLMERRASRDERRTPATVADIFSVEGRRGGLCATRGQTVMRGSVAAGPGFVVRPELAEDRQWTGEGLLAVRALTLSRVCQVPPLRDRRGVGGQQGAGLGGAATAQQKPASSRASRRACLDLVLVILRAGGSPGA